MEGLRHIPYAFLPSLQRPVVLLDEFLDVKQGRPLVIGPNRIARDNQVVVREVVSHGEVEIQLVIRMLGQSCAPSPRNVL